MHVDLAHSRKRLLWPAHQFVFQRGIARIIVRRADLGPIVHAEAMICSAGTVGQPDAARDRIAMEVLPHQLSLLARLFPGQLPSVRWNVQNPQPGQLRINGVLGEACVSDVVSMAGRPTLNQLHLIGERASARADLLHGFAVIESGQVLRLRKATRPVVLFDQTFSAALANLIDRAAHRELAYPALDELVRHFYDAIRSGTEPPFSDGEILTVAKAPNILLS